MSVAMPTRAGMGPITKTTPVKIKRKNIGKEKRRGPKSMESCNRWMSFTHMFTI